MNAVTDWNPVKTFLVVANHLHRVDAARQLGISERTLRRRLAQLESEVGVALVSRTRTTLTPAGRWLRDALAQPLAQANEALLDARHHTTATVVIAIGTELPYCWTERVGDWLQCTDHQARVELRAADEALDQLRSGELDLALLANEPAGPYGQIVGDEPVVVVFPEDHPAARQDAVRPGDLADLPVAVGDPDSEEWQRLAQRLQGHGDVELVTAPRLATISQGLIRAARSHGAAALTLAPAAAQADTTGLAIRPLHPPLTVPVTLLARADVPAEVTASLADHLIDVPRLPSP